MKLIRYFSIVIIAVSLLSTAAMADWPMWGGTPSRNMVGNGMKVSIDFDLQKGKEGNVVWQQSLGSQTYGNPVVADGKVFVGTNNGGGWRKDKYPAEQDKGVVLAFNEEDGEFLWQLTRDKLPIGRVSDWLLQGICSVPVVEDKRMYVVTNRCELMCLDTEGFRDGKNDGEVTDEVDATEADADIIWSLDMIDELGVFPHNLATSSPVVHGDLIYLLTSNGVDEGHLDVPAARSPCFLAVNKNTGEVAWDHNQPFDKILHGQWSSPALGEVNGKMQVFFPGGDGVLYAHDAVTGEEIWRFDLNPKATKWELYGKGTRNSVISTPVFHDNSVILAVGQDPEHGEGVGHLWRIDATKNGDVSPEIGEIGSPGKPNPNSAVIWHYGGEMETEAGEKEPMFRRTMSTVSVYEDMVFAADLSGFVHCIDLAEGTRHWEHDLYDGVWGSTLAVDGKVFLGSEEGSLTIFKASKEKAEVLDKKDTVEFSSIYSTPTFTNGRMYLSDRTRLYAVDVTKPTTAAAPLAAAGATAGTAAGIAAGTHPETAEGGSAGASGGAVTNGEGGHADGHADGHAHGHAHGHADGHAGAAVAAGTTGAESADGYGNSLMFPILILLLVLVVLGALVMGDDELRAKFDGMFKRK